MNEQVNALAQQLHEWWHTTTIDELELSGHGTCIRLHKTSPSRPDAPQPSATELRHPATTLLRAGSVGTFLHRHPFREDTLVQTGQAVEAGQTVALLKIGAVLISVTAPHAGTVLHILAENDSVVGYGDGLLEIMETKHHAN